VDPRRFWSEVEAAKKASGTDSLRQATLLQERLQRLPLWASSASSSAWSSCTRSRIEPTCGGLPS
jgi:hypothetical protein